MDEEDSGGETACWLSLACPECGALREDLTAACWRCGLTPGERPRV